MSTGWLLLGFLVMVVVGVFLAGVYRGAVKKARADTRQDLIRLGSVSEMAKTLTGVSSVPTYAFVAPFAEGRSHPFGWLWWRVGQQTHEPAESGWALTYRRARKAAGLPLSIRAQHCEITLAVGQERHDGDS